MKKKQEPKHPITQWDEILKRIATISLVLFITSGFMFSKKTGKAVKKAIITYYNKKYNGRRCSSGEIYSDTNLTCATTNKKFLGHKIKLWDQNTQKSVVVKCNDLMAPDNKLRFDLTTRAFKKLNNNSLRCGVMRLEYMVLN